ncbi:trimeric intracellular cation channel family protein [Clostridium saccharobutylicum]|uniref:Glycine transporter domain-containing protein n=1 Tax=Clostridium saccharobutylicum TaxID=169679 RepID=A0A1S8NI36_CLOSA|nr:TRIC cation channel family protein [Clostridium saccharobutylicum]OOM16078.1 hypothetical protein CLOSAC_03490 [Clostridium saccharobutylicum]
MNFLFAASITGVGGGMLRDIITNRKPEIFKTDIYCVAGIIGSLLLWGLYPIFGTHIAQHMSLVTIFSIRMVCYMKKINLPVIN